MYPAITPKMFKMKSSMSQDLPVKRCKNSRTHMATAKVNRVFSIRFFLFIKGKIKPKGTKSTTLPRRFIVRIRIQSPCAMLLGALAAKKALIVAKGIRLTPPGLIAIELVFSKPLSDISQDMPEGNLIFNMGKPEIMCTFISGNSVTPNKPTLQSNSKHFAISGRILSLLMPLKDLCFTKMYIIRVGIM